MFSTILPAFYYLFFVLSYYSSFRFLLLKNWTYSIRIWFALRFLLSSVQRKRLQYFKATKQSAPTQNLILRFSFLKANLLQTIKIEPCGIVLFQPLCLVTQCNTSLRVLTESSYLLDKQAHKVQKEEDWHSHELEIIRKKVANHEVLCKSHTGNYASKLSNILTFFFSVKFTDHTMVWDGRDLKDHRFPLPCYCWGRGLSRITKD